MFVDIDSLNWLVTFMREEVRLQGVPEIVTKRQPEQNSRVTFNFRDESYTARVLLSTGKSQKRVAYVKTRIRTDGDLAHLSRDQACAVIVQELKDWQQQVLIADGQVQADMPGA